MSEARMVVGGKEVRYLDEDDLIEVNRPEEISQFKSEAEEAAFWDTHTLSSAYWRAGGPESDAIRKATEKILANGRHRDSPPAPAREA